MTEQRETFVATIPYCGIPPTPQSLVERWNLDPVLLICLAVLAVSSIAAEPRRWKYLVCGWTLATLALVSPLCALSVSLFSARISQHLILTFIAAPLVAVGLPETWRARPLRWTFIFSAVLWFWHMPAPYDTTFQSVGVYWLMHVTLFGSGVMLWHGLLRHDPDQALRAIGSGTVASMAMGLLGAVFALSTQAMFAVHYLTTGAWGLSPVRDQQLGGVLMWVPAIAVFLFAAIRSGAMLSVDHTARRAIG
jgi:putative membrane protein